MPLARRRRPRRPGHDLLKRVALALLAGSAIAAVLAGCGGKKAAVPNTTTTASRTVRVYLLRHGKVQPVARTVSETKDLPVAAVAELVERPTVAERELGLVSAVQEIEGLVVSGPVAHVPGFDRVSLAQIVYTLTQFSTVKRVEVGGKAYTRKDFEDLTPAILVESPLPEQSVGRPLRVSGTANTFEATFEYELLDSHGKVIAKHFVTATSGSGTRGTFDFTVPYPSGHGGLGKLVVYESSAKDGSRINVVPIPVQLSDT